MAGARSLVDLASSIDAPCESMSGMVWADGFLCIGEYNASKVHQVDPQSGAIVGTLVSDRFVTGATWVQGELWHCTLQDGASEPREIDPQSGTVRRRIALPQGTQVSGLESNGSDMFYCGGASSGKLRAVRRSQRRKTLRLLGPQKPVRIARLCLDIDHGFARE
jgi:hypothetical protein